MLDEAHESIEKVVRRMKKHVHKGQRPLEFHMGGRSLWITPQIWKKISSKAAQMGVIPKYDGPFKVM